METQNNAAGALLTVKQAASVANCHEESIRRAYWFRQLRVLRFGVRGVRIRPDDLEDWIRQGMKTRPQ
jgi:excisionase family DNA binding protein